MCLMIEHPAATVFDYDDIADFYQLNPDGIGMMQVRDGAVHVAKTLPKSAAEAYEFYLTHVRGVDCAIHFRMKTHGLVDMINCHPYEVPGTAVWLMHNGVLSTGNDKDKTKSDTWHYARDYIRPLLVKYPDLLFETAFQEMLGEHIGSGNRFILMSPVGSVVINRHHGVEHKGAWLSNEYAWSAPFKRSNYNNYAWRGRWDFDVEEDQEDQEAQEDQEGQEAQALQSSVDDAMEYFFSVIEDCALWDCYARLQYGEIESAIYKVGLDGFYSFCDWIVSAKLDDIAVMDYIKHPQDIPEFEEVTP